MGPQVAIVGAGPAGMSAARVLADAGGSVIVVDEQEIPRGQVIVLSTMLAGIFRQAWAHWGGLCQGREPHPAARA